MASGSGRRATRAGRRDRMTRSSASCPRSSRSALGSPTVWRAQATARIRVLVDELGQLPRGDREVDRPAHAEYAIGEHDLARRIPVGGAQALDRRHAEVVGHDAGDLAAPGALGLRLAQLLVERGEERDPYEGAQKLQQIVHATSAGGTR